MSYQLYQPMTLDNPYFQLAARHRVGAAKQIWYRDLHCSGEWFPIAEPNWLYGSYEYVESETDPNVPSI